MTALATCNYQLGSKTYFHFQISVVRRAIQSTQETNRLSRLFKKKKLLKRKVKMYQPQYQPEIAIDKVHKE